MSETPEQATARKQQEAKQFAQEGFMFAERIRSAVECLGTSRFAVVRTKMVNNVEVFEGIEYVNLEQMKASGLLNELTSDDVLAKQLLALKKLYKLDKANRQALVAKLRELSFDVTANGV